jgi:hypothetical protein
MVKAKAADCMAGLAGSHCGINSQTHRPLYTFRGATIMFKVR